MLRVLIFKNLFSNRQINEAASSQEQQHQEQPNSTTLPPHSLFNSSILTGHQNQFEYNQGHDVMLLLILNQVLVNLFI